MLLGTNSKSSKARLSTPVVEGQSRGSVAAGSGLRRPCAASSLETDDHLRLAHPPPKR